jgi:hypothetical protein
MRWTCRLIVFAASTRSGPSSTSARSVRLGCWKGAIYSQVLACCVVGSVWESTGKHQWNPRASAAAELGPLSELHRQYRVDSHAAGPASAQSRGEQPYRGRLASSSYRVTSGRCFVQPHHQVAATSRHKFVGGEERLKGILPDTEVCVLINPCRDHLTPDAGPVGQYARGLLVFPFGDVVPVSASTSLNCAKPDRQGVPGSL